jgi:hypothetical protein
VDPLDRLGRIRPALATELVEENEAGLGDAPATIAQKELIERRRDDPLIYRPDLGVLEDFDVPDCLPDLTGIYLMKFNHITMFLGIAPDISFSELSFVSIAPSAFENVAKIDYLPDILPNPTVIGKTTSCILYRFLFFRSNRAFQTNNTTIDINFDGCTSTTTTTSAAAATTSSTTCFCNCIDANDQYYCNGTTAASTSSSSATTATITIASQCTSYQIIITI